MSQSALIPRPLTAAAFAPFGDVLSVTSATPKTINYGHTVRYDTGAHLSLDAQNGRPGISIFRATPLAKPIQIALMERHPLSSQAFYPLSGRPFLVVVAPRGDLDPANICAFVAAPDQGVNYHPGIWHHYLLALEAVSDFLVVDRLGNGENCDEVQLSPPLVVEIPQ
ncbi:MAG: ureidoglycolate lyase [Robiginitomaculum sp.]|nr:ureidoglycolate lyase [Robiginitomaculum sp.]MDQ7077783.1 ureidoglycolate lyase [Robiginitomaculum sp.]